MISGAGIAGPTLAYWLRVAGFEPTLVECAPALRTGGYVIDFWGLGYEIAERMGLGGDLDAIGYHMRELRIVNDKGDRADSFGTKVLREITGGRFVTLGRSDLSRLLFEKIDGASEVMFGDEIAAIEEQADGVQVRFRYAGERRFDLVIGADGLHSTVRRLVFGSEDRFEKRLGYTVAAFEVRGYRPRDEEVYVTYGVPGRMLGRFALHDDRTLFLFVFASAGDAKSVADDLTAQKATLRKTYSDAQWECPRILEALAAATELYYDRVSQIRMEGWSRGRVALVGDAAFCISLMGGQGSALAMTAAYVLAGELARAEGRYEEAFGNYEKLLRSYIVSKQRAASGLARAFAPKTRFGLFVRNLVVNACAIPGLARFAFGRDMIDRLALPTYQWAAPLVGR